MALPPPSPYKGKCKLTLCKKVASFQCRCCGKLVCANHSGAKSTDYKAVCGKCALQRNFK